MIVALDYFYLLLGGMLSVVAAMSWRDVHNPKRRSTALFWGLYAFVYLAGERLAPAVAGALMILMGLIAGFGGVSLGRHGSLSGQQRRSNAQRLGHRLFLPALVIPLVTMLGSTLLKDVKLGSLFLLDQRNVTLASLGVACLVSLALACRITHATPLQALRESRRLIDAMGWAVVLPHMLAVLGLLFSDAGVGKAVAHVTTSYLNLDSRLAAVAVYCVGMALFTIIMGNGFAAFPVMTGGVGMPVLIGVYHCNPAIMGAIGMFSGYCGTLMTPMAANFNIVPAALLGLPDKNSVIKAQIPTALPLLAVNIFLLYFLMYQ